MHYAGLTGTENPNLPHEPKPAVDVFFQQVASPLAALSLSHAFSGLKLSPTRSDTPTFRLSLTAVSNLATSRLRSVVSLFSRFTSVLASSLRPKASLHKSSSFSQLADVSSMSAICFSSSGSNAKSRCFFSWLSQQKLHGSPNRVFESFIDWFAGISLSRSRIKVSKTVFTFLSPLYLQNIVDFVTSAQLSVLFFNEQTSRVHAFANLSTLLLFSFKCLEFITSIMQLLCEPFVLYKLCLPLQHSFVLFPLIYFV